MQPRVQVTFFGGRVTGYAFPCVGDGDASLVPVDFADVPIAAIRSFVVSAPSGTTRGGHGHQSGRQLLVRVSGEIELELAFDGASARLVLGEATNAALVEAPVWSRQTYRGDSPRLMVLCDTPYDPESYLYEHPSPA